MTKHRLELFSDGVFVIVLTLLVLDLKPPMQDGWAGLKAIAPGLIVHALTFFVIGVQWLNHHIMLARVYEVKTRTLALNLLALFFVTLIPFGARIAAEHPLGSLGIGLINACRGFWGLGVSAMMLTASSRLYADPALRPGVIRRRLVGLGLAIAYLLAAVLGIISPWFGYAAIPLALLSFVVMPPAVPEAGHAALEPDAAGEAADDILPV